MNKPQAVLTLQGIHHTYQQGGREINVLAGADLSLHRGETVGLIGPSGSGKSTLLHLAGLLEKPQAGQIFLNGDDISHANDAQRTALRREHVGFVYQFHNLLPEFTALENITLPMQIAGQKKAEARQRAQGLLEKLGLAERAGHLPSEMSGGEQQRVAIARALANRPSVILADEPTGSLDPRTGTRVLDVLISTVREAGASLFIASHNMDLVQRLDRTLQIESGQLVNL